MAMKLPKEDFKEIEWKAMPKEFRNSLKKRKKYITKCFVNSEDVYRVQITDCPIKEFGIFPKNPEGSWIDFASGVVSFMIDYGFGDTNGKTSKGFDGTTFQRD